jgi:predicted dehydrogenase
MRTAIVGTGGIARAHAQAVAALNDRLASVQRGSITPDDPFYNGMAYVFARKEPQ